MNARLAESLADRYRIEREIGQGGMATVYIAHDIRHDRDVAVKVLHPDLGAALGGDRFLSEIRTTARLQHPHILPLLDSGNADGLLYYVMPLVTGETLRARLEREKQLPVNDALRIAREVADALFYAHGHGVIHRDIKPENILLQDGHALVADFGIALAVQSAGGQRMTQTGLSLGTPQYMSPEQAMGERNIDARSDVYSLAAVTYEMFIGEAPFTGPTVQAIVARVMSEDPRPLSTQRKAIPEQVDYAVLRGLEKLPADRWASAHEFAEALQSVSTDSAARRSGTTRLAGRVRKRGALAARLRDPVVLTLGGIAIAMALIAATGRRQAVKTEEPVVRFTLPGSPSARNNVLGLSTLAVSSDGRMFTYPGRTAAGRMQLMLRTIDDVTPRGLPGTDGAEMPVFSPDGKTIAFFRANQLYRVSVDGGTPQFVGQAEGTFAGASWSSRGVIVASNNLGLYVLPESGGQSKSLLTADRSKGVLYIDAPLVVDDYGVVLYSSWSTAAMTSASIAVASMETGAATVLDVRGVQPLGIVDGVLVYVTAAGNIMGVRIDVAKRRVTGTPVQLATDVSLNPTSGIARAAVSKNGTLVYQAGSQLSQVVLASESGAAQALLDEPRDYSFPRLSPDGTRLAFAIGTADRRDVWLYEIGPKTLTRLTTAGTLNERPEWSPDGKRVLYRSDVSSRAAIWWRPADLSAPGAPLLGGPGIDLFEAVISPDGRYVAYQLDTAGADIFYRAMSGDTTPVAVANGAAIEYMPRISPDGRWIAFVTDESGKSEVVVQPFPGPGGRVQVSGDGGTEPVWSRDGRRLFYRGDNGLISATIRPGSAFEIASRSVLMADDYVYATNPHANYDVLPDGRFVFLKSTGTETIVVVTNWKSIVRARMSAGAAPR